ncbi:MAG: S41 family peptidase [Gemmataceae bacterium]|nr:S41 family peptidase [Gemmataceae bacterium]
MYSAILRAKILVLLALLVLPLGLLNAQSVAPNTHAVLVGIDSYSDAKIKPRKHAEADIKALHELIVSKDYLGADPKNVHMLLAKQGDKDGPAIRDNILKSLDAVVAKAGPNDLVLFAFFGQGCPLGEQVGFFGTDGTAKDRLKTALNGADIAKALEGLKAKRFCAFIDINLTDFENAKDTVRELDLRSLAGMVMGDQDGPATKRPTGRVMVLASNGLTATLQLDKHGLFAKTLIDGMKGKADREGYEPDGAVTINELTKYLDEELPRAARQIGKTKEEKGQAAIVLRNPPTHFTVSRTPVAVKTTELRLANFAKQKDVVKEVRAEGQRLLSTMPLVKYQQELRKSYQKFADGSVTHADFLKDRERIFDANRLTREDAGDYARRIQGALDIVSKNYVKEMDAGELAGGAVRGLYQSADEPIPSDLADRLAAAKGLNLADILELLTDARERLHRREDLEQRKAEEMTLKYVFSRFLDKYSYYVDADAVRRFKADTSGLFTGVGIQVRRDPVKDMIVVITPIKDGPSHKAGVMAGDWIREIRRDMDSEGNRLEQTEVIPGEGIVLDDAIKKIIGNPGTKVRLVFEREGVAKPVEIELTRAYIKTESVFGVKRKNDDTWTHMLDDENKIGYARLGSFTDYTHLQLEAALKDLKLKGMKGFILDLRFCPGGKLNTAFRVAEIFINKEPIVAIRYRGKPELKFTGNRPNNANDFPMAVLINRNSASASELVSACWQDHKRAVIIGDRTFGKGTVATTFPFTQTGGMLNIATASFWRPSGKNLEKILTEGRDDEDWGVQPNEGFRVKLGRNEEADLFDHLRKQEIIPRRDRVAKDEPSTFKDAQLEKAVEHLRGAAK